MRRIIGLTCGAALSLALVSPVLAARPANRACAGETIRQAAQAGRDYGQFVAAVAMDIRGVGEEVQLILAGDLLDSDFPNTCND